MTMMNVNLPYTEVWIKKSFLMGPSNSNTGNMMKIWTKKIACSFSGGRTSAVMTRLVIDWAEKHKKSKPIITFANTGCEHPDTLRFVEACDENWGFETVWLEAVVTHGQRIGIRHKIVDFETASRNGEPFEEYIKKYGIPNASIKQCTSRLKTEVMESYLKTIGFFRGKKLNYTTCIGIRADEMDRMSIHRKKNKFAYPMVQRGWTKEMVLEYMSQFPWDLKIPEHYGNCVWCYKKSDRKLFTLAQEDPSVFSFPQEMERKYSNLKANSTREDGRRVFFRKNRDTNELLAQAQDSDFEKFIDPHYEGGCGGGSCEVYNSTDEY